MKIIADVSDMETVLAENSKEVRKKKKEKRDE